MWLHGGDVVSIAGAAGCCISAPSHPPSEPFWTAAGRKWQDRSRKWVFWGRDWQEGGGSRLGEGRDSRGNLCCILTLPQA